MRTKVINAYKFGELSNNVQQILIKKYRNTVDTDYIYNEAYSSVKEFNNIFDLTENPYNWLYFTANNCLAISGERLQRYIWNNYANKLFKGKYYPVKANHSIRHNRVKSKAFKNGNVFNGYYSAITLSNDCVLTGVYYDMDLLDPIYRFLGQRGEQIIGIGLVDLLNECFNNLRASIKNEVDYICSDEYIIEQIMDEDLDYTENGTAI